MKAVVAALVTIGVVACTQDVNVARHTVEEYRANAVLRREIFAKCVNDPGTLGQSADCVNALEAERLESRGSLREQAPLGLSRQVEVAMGFFAEFDAWLTDILSRYIADNTAAIARILEPAIVTLGVFYVVVWGYLHLLGKIEEPFVEGAKRLLTLALILGLSLQLWLYNEAIVDTFFSAPTELAAGVIAARDPSVPPFEPVAVVDEIFFDGDDAASLLMEKGEIFGRDILFYFAAFSIYLTIGLTAVYTMFLLAISRIALAVLLALGPLFMALLFFESTKRFFEAWLAQLSNYAFLTVLTVLVAALMLQVVSTAAEAAVATGGSIDIANAIKVCIATTLTFLIMRQVPAMAQGLASGIALSGFGVVGSTLRMALGAGRFVGKRAGEFSRGALLDRDTSRWDSVSRKAGQRLIGARMPRERRPRQNVLRYNR